MLEKNQRLKKKAVLPIERVTEEVDERVSE